MNKEYDIKLKNKWEDITIDDYFRLKAVTNMLDIISILTDVPKEDLEDYPLQLINDLIEETDFIHTQVPVKDTVEDELIKVRVEDGKEVMYRLNLNVGEWESGRFIDFMEFSSDAETVNDNMHLLMVLACDKFIKTKGKWYKFGKSTWEKVQRKDRDLMEEAEFGLYNFPISSTLTYLTFFLITFERFSEDIADSSAFIDKVVKEMRAVDKIIRSSVKQHSTMTSSGSYG